MKFGVLGSCDHLWWQEDYYEDNRCPSCEHRGPVTRLVVLTWPVISVALTLALLLLAAVIFQLRGCIA